MKLLGGVIVLALLAGGGYLWSSADRANRTDETARVTISVSRATVESLEWSQVMPLIEVLNGSGLHQEYFLDLVNEKAPQPSIYAAALIYLGRDDAQQAMELVDALDVDEMPDVFLYPVFRLWEERNQDVSEIFLRLVEAAKEGQLQPLVAGRVLIRAGEFNRALVSYRRVSPANWSVYDLEGFGLALAHAGYERDFRSLISGGLRSSVIRPEIKEQAMSLLNQSSNETAMLSVASEDLTTPELTSKTKLLFLQKKYSDLHTLYAETDVRDVSDEGVLLLFVSAVAINDRFLADKWGFELDRRVNDLETRQWIASIKADLG